MLTLINKSSYYWMCHQSQYHKWCAFRFDLDISGSGTWLFAEFLQMSVDMVYWQWLAQESWEWSEILVSLKNREIKLLKIKITRTIRCSRSKLKTIYFLLQSIFWKRYYYCKSKSKLEVNDTFIKKLKLYLHLISWLSLVLFLFPIQFQKRDKKLFYVCETWSWIVYSCSFCACNEPALKAFLYWLYRTCKSSKKKLNKDNQKSRFQFLVKQYVQNNFVIFFRSTCLSVHRMHI